MIGNSSPRARAVSTVSPAGTSLNDSRPSSAGEPAVTLHLPHSPVNSGSGGPLLTLQTAGALPAQAAGHVQAPPASGRLARARDYISDFVTKTGRLLAGTDSRKYLAARAWRLEKSLNEAVAGGKSHAEVARLLETAVKVRYELSQFKGTEKAEELRLLNECLEMYDGVDQAVTAEKVGLKHLTWDIARKAHAVQFNLATGMNFVHNYFGDTCVKGPRPQASDVDLLGWARAAALFQRAHARPAPGLNALLGPQELRHMPMGNPIVGSRLTDREIDCWCKNENPWPIEPRLQQFYDAAKLAASEARVTRNAERRELLGQHVTPDPDQAGRNDPTMYDLIAEYVNQPENKNSG